jgi:hypothetical protein
MPMSAVNTMKKERSHIDPIEKRIDRAITRAFDQFGPDLNAFLKSAQRQIDANRLEQRIVTSGKNGESRSGQKL